MQRCALMLLGILALHGCGTGGQVSDADLDAAIGQLTQFSFEEPIDTLRRARAGSEVGSERWQKATYALAVCLHQVSPVQPANLTEADTLYGEIVDKAPGSVFAPRSLLNRGRLAELIDFYQDKIDLPKAREYYATIATTWPDQDIAGEATLRRAGTYIQTNDPADVTQGIAVLSDWLAAHPQDPLAAAMWHYLGDTYFLHQADHAKAVAAYRAADDLGLMWRGRESIVWWRIARIAEEHLKDRDLAVRYYTRICTDAQTSGRAFEAQKALAKLGAPIPELTAFSSYPGERPPLGNEAEVTP